MRASAGLALGGRPATLLLVAGLCFALGCDQSTETSAGPGDSGAETDTGPVTEDAQVDGADVGDWVWDDSELDRPCERLTDDCGEGNICLADVSYFPPPDDQTSGEMVNRQDVPGFYHCQRKCTADIHCSDLEMSCTCVRVGNGESDIITVYLSVCLPPTETETFPLSDCIESRPPYRAVNWPPVP